LRSKAFKFFLGGLLAGLILLLISLNGLLIWVVTGPRSLDNLAPYIESAFQSQDAEFSVKIGHIVLRWAGWKRPVDIRMQNVAVLTREGMVFSTFPEIAVDVDVFSLALGRVRPTSLTIEQPIISLLQNEDRSVSFGVKSRADTQPADSTAAPQQSLLPFAALVDVMLGNDKSSPLHKLRSLRIEGADISLGSIKKGVLLETKNTQITIRRNRRGQVEGMAAAQMRYGEHETPITAQVQLSRDDEIVTGDLVFSHLQPEMLANLLNDESAIKAIMFPLSGELDFVADKSGVLQKLTFAIEGGKGLLRSPELDGDIPVTSITAQGEVSNNVQDIAISKLEADLDGMLLKASGSVKLLPDRDAAIIATVGITNVPGDKVRLFWPPGLSPQSREWITTNIYKGKVLDAVARVNIAPGDLAKPVLPRETVSASLKLEDATIRYLPEHPELTHVNGTVSMDAITLKADIHSAQFLKDVKISGAQLVLEDLNQDNPYITVEGGAQAPATDVLHILALPRIQKAERLNLKDAGITGSVKARVALGFYFYATGRDDDITYNIKADATDIAQDAVLKKFDIKALTGGFTIDPSMVTFEGQGNVNGAELSRLQLKYMFSPDEKGFDTFIQGAGRVGVADLPRFGLTLPPSVKGMLDVTGSIQQSADNDVYDVQLNLLDASINEPDYLLIKPEKQPAKMEIQVKNQAGKYSIPSINLTGDGGLALKGSAALLPDLSGIAQISLEKFAIGKTALDTVFYERFEKGNRLSLIGSTLDLTQWMKDGEGEGFSFEHFPPGEYSVNIAKIILGEGKDLNHVKAGIKCDATRCPSANIVGNVGAQNKAFDFNIAQPARGGKRELSVHAGDAGALIRTLGLFEGMDGGELAITGTYDDSAPKSLLTAKLEINQHTIKDAPILAKILSLASLTGFFDTLQGNGIAFKRLSIPFTLQNDVITITGGKTYGSAMGMTADGTITMPQAQMDISGTVVPSYSVNTVLGKVPLIGDWLMGGEGQGVFAARYAIRGTEEKNDVSVNPLSILTPGFLRGLFDVFDEPKKAPQAKPERGKSEKTKL